MIGRELGPYRIRAELGVGAMGTVYLAETEAGEARALKVVHPALLVQPGFFKRFMREAQAGRRIKHENVVRTYDADALLVDGTPHHFLVMEYVEGRTLRDLLNELGRVPEELCRRVARAIAGALQAIHASGAVHRDLKPENVLITPDHVVKVMDLGVAHLADESVRLSRTGQFLGSVLYAAPEQLDGAEPDPAADWYALGLLLYELATGKHPSHGTEFAEIVRMRMRETPPRIGAVNPQVSPFFEEVVAALLDRDVEARLDHVPDEDSAWWRERAEEIRQQTKQPLRRIRIPRETALHGRAAELEKLGGIFERVQAGRGQVVLVDGEAGIGKTRLVDEFVTALPDATFLYGSYPPDGSGDAFAGAFAAHLGEAGSERYLAEAPLLAAPFDALLAGNAPSDLHRDAARTAFVHVMRALAEERPIVLVIDDLHFAPDEGRELFAGLGLALQRHRIMLVGTTRPGLPGEWLAELRATRLPLQRLSADDVSGLLDDWFGADTIARDLSQRIAERAGGNPFFAFEILRVLREGGHVERGDDGRWVPKAVGKIAIPSSVLDLIKARIADLDDEDVALLEAAACAGFEFDPEPVAAALGISLIPALHRLAWIEKQHRIVHAAGHHFVFDHHQVQEALYESLEEPRRKEHHAALGRELETLGAAPTELAEHFLRGGCGDRARPYLDDALRHLAGQHHYDRAAVLADRALNEDGLLDTPARIHMLLEKTSWYDTLGAREKEAEAIEELIALAKETGDTEWEARARATSGSLFMRTTRLEEAEPELMAAIELARGAGRASTEARALVELARGQLMMGRAAEAEPNFERAWKLAQEIGDKQREAHALLGMAEVCYNASRYEDGLVFAERALALAPESGDPRLEVQSHRAVGMAHKLTGRYKDARRHWSAGLERAKEIGFRMGECVCTINLGNIHLIQAEYDDSRRYHEPALALAHELGNRNAETTCLTNLGLTDLWQGYYANAKERFTETIRIGNELKLVELVASVTGSLGLVNLWLGRVDEALGHFQHGLALTEKIGEPVGMAALLGHHGEVELQREDYVAAEPYFHDALATTCEHGDRLLEAHLRLGLGRALAGQDKPEEAADQFRASKALGDELELPEVSMLAAAWIARLTGDHVEEALHALEKAGRAADVAMRVEARLLLYDATQDRELLPEAHRILMQTRDRSPEEDRERILQAVPVHRKIVERWNREGFAAL